MYAENYVYSVLLFSAKNVSIRKTIFLWGTNFLNIRFIVIGITVHEVSRELNTNPPG